MAIATLQRPSAQRARAWLVANWPAAAWLVALVAINVAGATGIREYYRQAIDLTDIPEHDRAELRRSLASLHLSVTHLVWFQIFTNVVATLVNLTIGWLLIRRAPRTRFACYLAFVLLALTNAQYPPSIADLYPGHPVSQAIIRLTTVVAVSGFFMLPLIFPDGRFVPRWTALVGVYILYSLITFAFFAMIALRSPFEEMASE